MNEPNKLCLVLRPEVTRAEFEVAATDLGFEHHRTNPGDGSRIDYEQVWAIPSVESATAAVHYLESVFAPIHSLIIRGADVLRLAERLAARLPTFTHDQLVGDALHATDHNDQVRAINRLAVGFVDFDPTVFTIISTFATKAESPLLRAAAVNAAGFRAWPQFRSMLEAVATEDLDGSVRRHAAEIIPHIPPPRG
jgi:hypothetical protein